MLRRRACVKHQVVWKSGEGSGERKICLVAKAASARVSALRSQGVTSRAERHCPATSHSTGAAERRAAFINYTRAKYFRTGELRQAEASVMTCQRHASSGRQIFH